MIISIILCLGLGYMGAFLAKKLKLPALIGMLIVGILIGPFGFNLLQESFLDLSQTLRTIALIIILIRAGLNLKLSDLKVIGLPAFLLIFVPASFEIAAITFLAPLLFNLTYMEAALLGTILAAVSPAVVVPRMINLMNKGYGTAKKIPQMVMAGASLDDVYALVLFTAFLSLNQNQSVSIMQFVTLPLELILGVVMGACIAYLLYRVTQMIPMAPILKSLIILGLSIALVHYEALLPMFKYSGYLACMSLSMVFYACDMDEILPIRDHFEKLWSVFEIFLFVLVGASVGFNNLKEIAIPATLLILGGLCIRSIGVIVSMKTANLTPSELLFTIFAYSPKATVQAALGSAPLEAGLVSGNLILGISVASIIICAPLGAILVDSSYKKLLKQEIV